MSTGKGRRGGKGREGEERRGEGKVREERGGEGGHHPLKGVTTRAKFLRVSRENNFFIFIFKVRVIMRRVN